MGGANPNPGGTATESGPQRRLGEAQRVGLGEAQDRGGRHRGLQAEARREGAHREAGPGGDGGEDRQRHPLAHDAAAVEETPTDAVGEGDADKAVQVWNSDRAVDDIYNAIFRELITYMMEDPRSISSCAHLLFIAKNLERVGDHATNIAENVYYAATGESLPDARPKGDTSAYAVVRPREA